MDKIIAVAPLTERADGKSQQELAEYYCRSVAAAGAKPLLLPRGTARDAEGLLRGCDGLLLTGGEDVAPGFYNEEKTEQCGEIDPRRDEFEFGLVAAAERQNKPVLGICRGIQLLNVFYGGTLYQDIENQMALPNTIHRPGHYELCHRVRILPGTRLADILGAGIYYVNSRHHQCVKNAALPVAAICPDSVIEALEMPGERFVVGVQWHPERMEDGRLFRALAEACVPGEH